jgi:CRP-like cAMP-binding protein
MADEEQAVRIAREVVLSTFAGDVKGLTWAFTRISAAMQDLYLEEGAVLFAEGGVATYQYFVVDGEVKMSGSGTGTRELTFGPKTAVGMIDAILERPLSWTAVVSRKAHILRIRIEDWLEVLEDSFELARIIVTNIAAGLQRLRVRPPPLGGFDEPPAAVAMSDGPRQLHLVDRVMLLRGVPVFARASIQTLASLAELATELRADSGELLAPRGEPKRRLLIVASGEVSATCEGAPTFTGRFGRGALVCGALAVGETTDYELRATVQTRALAIAREDYLDVMEEHFGLLRSTLRALIEERDVLIRRG